MSDSRQQTRRRVSYTQLNYLWEFLNSHREIAVGYNKSAQAREHSKRMWETVTQTLNASWDGAIKSASEWSKYWVDLKAKIKRKNRLIYNARRGTGGGPSVDELTEIEQKFLSILGTDYGSGLPGIQVEPIVTQDISEEVTINENISQGIQIPDLESVAPSLPELTPPANEPNLASSGTPHTLPVQVQRTRQRRQRRSHRLTAEEVRRKLVEASQTRAQAELATSHSIERGVNLLSDLVLVLTRMDERLARIESHSN